MSTINWISLSGLLVSLSGVYYLVLVFTRRAPGNPVSWASWAVIGWAILLTSGAPFGCNAQTFGAVNPTAIAIVALWRQFYEAKALERREVIGGSLGLFAIGLWLFADHVGAPKEWILGLSIAADCLPLWLIAEGVWRNPKDDKPFAWLLFMLGYSISVLGLPEYTWFTLALPLYMVIGSGFVAWPLVMYRARAKAPIRQWA